MSGLSRRQGRTALVECIRCHTSDASVLHDGEREESRALVEGAVAHTRHGAGDDEVAPQSRALVEGAVSNTGQGAGKCQLARSIKVDELGA